MKTKSLLLGVKFRKLLGQTLGSSPSLQQYLTFEALSKTTVSHADDYATELWVTLLFVSYANRTTHGSPGPTGTAG